MPRGKETVPQNEVKPKRKYQRREKVSYPYTLIVEMDGKKPQTVNAYSIRMEGGFLKCVVGPNHEQWFDEHSILTLDLQTTVVQQVQPIRLAGTGTGIQVSPQWIPNTAGTTGSLGAIPMTLTNTAVDGLQLGPEAPEVFVNPHLAAARSSASDLSKARKPVSAALPDQHGLPKSQIAGADGKIETVGASIV